MNHAAAIRSAGPEDEARVLATITLAFANDPVARWVTPDPYAYLANMPGGIRAFGGPGFPHGTVFLTGDGHGAAMWLPPGVEPDAEALLAGISAHVPPARASDILALFEMMGEVHHRALGDEPHWYLPMIGVDPPWQGLGLGAALMRHAVARIDAEGRPAWLEASNPRSAGLYRRHGFEELPPVQVADAPPVVPMLRPPRR